MPIASTFSRKSASEEPAPAFKLCRTTGVCGARQSEQHRSPPVCVTESARRRWELPMGSTSADLLCVPNDQSETYRSSSKKRLGPSRVLAPACQQWHTCLTEGAASGTLQWHCAPMRMRGFDSVARDQCHGPEGERDISKLASIDSDSSLRTVRQPIRECSHWGFRLPIAWRRRGRVVSA